jgi:hypothetical protein
MSENEPGVSSLMFVVRWAAVVPAALVSDIFFASVFMHIARWHLGHLRLVHETEPLLLLFSGAVGTLAFVLFGALAAPKFRGFAALALLVLEAVAGSLFAGLMIGGALPSQSALAAALYVVGQFA